MKVPRESGERVSVSASLWNLEDVELWSDRSLDYEPEVWTLHIAACLVQPAISKQHWAVRRREPVLMEEFSLWTLQLPGAMGQQASVHQVEKTELKRESSLYPPQ